MYKRDIVFILMVFCAILSFIELALAQDISFQYPYALVDAHRADNDCWTGIGVEGTWPVVMKPEDMIIGPPPAYNVSALTIPVDSWVEVKFKGPIVNGPGDDIYVTEIDAVGEEALIFLTDGAGHEYPIGIASVPDSGEDGPTVIGFNISALMPGFTPTAIRVVGLDLRGASPGFDLAYVIARVQSDYSQIACNPYPLNGANNVSPDVVLSWSPGSSVNQHVVYFGDSPEDVDINAGPVSYPEQPQDINSFYPGPLELGKTYYWRIDQVNDIEPESPRIGDVWKFTVDDYMVIEDFESYERQPFRDNWTSLEEAWIDVSENPQFVHLCRNSMKFEYYCWDEYYSEARLNLNPQQDWASIGAKALELFFHPNTNSEPGFQMYLKLNDGSNEVTIPYADDPNNLLLNSWQPWRIGLGTIKGIDFNSITSLSIGFLSDPLQPDITFRGTIYFDDIRIYSSICLEENRSIADFNCDCYVDIADLDEMTSNWLEEGYREYPVAAPNSPLIWYAFDGNADDSVGNTQACVNGNPEFVSGVYGQAIKFDGYFDSIEVIRAENVFSQIRDAITIAFWQYGTESAHHTDTIFCSDYKYSVYDPAIVINLGLWKQPGDYIWDAGSSWRLDKRLRGRHKYTDQWRNRWNHWAFTKNAEDGTMNIYLNGELLDSREGSVTPITTVYSFEIGSGWYGNYDGMIDDLLIFDYALSQPEIACIATRGIGVFEQQLLSDVDLNGDNRIDFKDYAIFTHDWLTEQLFP